MHFEAPSVGPAAQANELPGHFDRRDSLTARADLASSYRRAGRIAEAISILEQVVADSQQLRGVKHPDTLNALVNLATCYGQAGRTTQAITILERLLDDTRGLLEANVVTSPSTDAPDLLSTLPIESDVSGEKNSSSIPSPEASKINPQAGSVFSPVFRISSSWVREAERTIRALFDEQAFADSPPGQAGGIRERVSLLLAELARTHGERAPDGSVIIRLRLSLAEVASATVASTESVARVLRELRAAGIVRTGRQYVAVLKPEALIKDGLKGPILNELTRNEALERATEFYLQLTAPVAVAGIYQRLVGDLEGVLGTHHPDTVTAREKFREWQLQANSSK
jgi:tetratricopeptide repeat protein/Crp-like helix-turn-helix protein